MRPPLRVPGVRIFRGIHMTRPGAVAIFPKLKKPSRKPQAFLATSGSPITCQVGTRSRAGCSKFSLRASLATPVEYGPVALDDHWPFGFAGAH